MEAKFFRFLKIVGVRYKAIGSCMERLLFLKLEYSHEVKLTVPHTVCFFCFKNNVVCLTRVDKQRPPQVYKGKGIIYIDEVIKMRKENYKT
ncbi:hypothetical protein UlMin_022119 [Ulmus minor]